FRRTTQRASRAHHHARRRDETAAVAARHTVVYTSSIAGQMVSAHARPTGSAAISRSTLTDHKRARASLGTGTPLAAVPMYEVISGGRECPMNPLIALVLLAAPFLLLGGALAFLIVTIGNATAKPR